jgi:hypothetical protein
MDFDEICAASAEFIRGHWTAAVSFLSGLGEKWMRGV